MTKMGCTWIPCEIEETKYLKNMQRMSTALITTRSIPSYYYRDKLFRRIKALHPRMHPDTLFTSSPASWMDHVSLFSLYWAALAESVTKLWVFLTIFLKPCGLLNISLKFQRHENRPPVEKKTETTARAAVSPRFPQAGIVHSNVRL